MWWWKCISQCNKIAQQGEAISIQGPWKSTNMGNLKVLYNVKLFIYCYCSLYNVKLFTYFLTWRKWEQSSWLWRWATDDCGIAEDWMCDLLTLGLTGFLWFVCLLQLATETWDSTSAATAKQGFNSALSTWKKVSTAFSFCSSSLRL